ncbi:MAG: hypothetical protein GC185_12000 [Alphaproteobacteria bacterium]|nr:hypothetical protein [Alphaproteobacteria bacterium]
MTENIVVIAALLLGAGVLFSRRLQQSQAWRATVTPLASIIGSGFLVSVPLLAGKAGNAAIFAMAGLIGLSWLIGGAVRFNIRHAEPLMQEPHKHGVVVSTERMSHLVLAFAYFISVAYYLVLLSTFLLKGMGHPDPLAAKCITTAILLAIGGTGFWRGLGIVERIEKYTVGANLAVIFALLAGLVWYNAALALHGQWALAVTHPVFDARTLRVILGVLIVVQGFETSRFLGMEYPAELRIKTMRYAQVISTVVYLLFFALVTVMFRLDLHDTGVAAIITLVGHVAPVLPFLLTLGAIASQFSASVADSVGATGLVHDITRREVPVRHAYPLVALVAIGVTWGTDVFGVINLASRAFALFYFMQCCVALLVTRKHTHLPRRAARTVLFAALALVCLAVVVFALPSGA